MDTLDRTATAELQKIFPKPQEMGDIPLPAEFDDACKKCGKPMERMDICCWTQQRPFATFQCQMCKVRLFLFEVPVTPFLMWSESLPKPLVEAQFFSGTAAFLFVTVTLCGKKPIL